MMALAMLALGVWPVCTLAVEAVTNVYPRVDGTMADGGAWGPFDGVPDHSDWYFNGNNYDGAITLTTETPQTSLEHRVVWEYDLSRVGFPLPVSATLTFTIRGTPIYGVPAANVHVYSYPADLLGRDSDFSAGPAVFQGSVIVPPYAPSTEYTFNVSEVVNQALASGTNKVGFRFQINPDTPYTINQAFIDVDEGDVTTKPLLAVTDTVPGDVNGDRVVDISDFSNFPGCMRGPDSPIAISCRVFDFDYDKDVDAEDLATYQLYFSASE